MKMVILNPSEVVGPYDSSNWGRLFFALRDGNLPAITNGCMSVTHVRSVVEAQLAAVEKGESGENYILGGVNCRFSDLVKEVAAVSGHAHIPKQIPAVLFKTIGYLQAGLSYITQKEPDLTPELAHMMCRKDVRFSSEKAINELDYHIAPLRQSVKDCYDWLKKERLL